VTRIENRCDTGQPLQDRRLKIVDHDFGRHTAKRAERVLVAGEEVLHRLRDGELDEHLAAESQHHDEERKPTPRIADGDASVGAPVDLCALAASKMQLQIHRALGRANAVDVIAHDADAAAITFLAEPLKNLLCAIGMGVEQARDARLERIKLAGARLAVPPCEARTRQPGRDRAPMKPQRARGLHDRQALPMVAIVDLTECLVIDHDRGPLSGSVMGPSRACENVLTQP